MFSIILFYVQEKLICQRRLPFINNSNLAARNLNFAALVRDGKFSFMVEREEKRNFAIFFISIFHESLSFIHSSIYRSMGLSIYWIQSQSSPTNCIMIESKIFPWIESLGKLISNSLNLASIFHFWFQRVFNERKIIRFWSPFDVNT